MKTESLDAEPASTQSDQDPSPSDPAAFYATVVAADECVLLAQAPTSADLRPEIALLRSRIAALLKKTTGAYAVSPELSRDFARLLGLLTRAVAVQARIQEPDLDLDQLNESIRLWLAAHPEFETPRETIP